jgi:hypothetical protein
MIPDTSAVLNIILHVIYNMSCIPQSPPFETLVTAVNQMPSYGFDPKKHIIQSHPTYGHLLSFAPLFPYGLYALASHFDIYDLAAAASSYLLSSSLLNISDDMAQRIGPIYLKRLLCLHAKRLHSLKNILLHPPHPHPPTAECNFAQQKQLEDVWAAGLVNLAWDATPGTYIYGFWLAHPYARTRHINAPLTSCVWLTSRVVLLRLLSGCTDGSPE